VAISGLLLLSALFKPYRSSGNVGATSWVRFGATLCEVMIGHESSLSHLRAKEEGWGENCQTARQNAGADQRRQPRRRLPETAPPIRGPFSGLGPLFPISGETGGLGWALHSHRKSRWCSNDRHQCRNEAGTSCAPNCAAAPETVAKPGR
jgi:hypothetical protein